MRLNIPNSACGRSRRRSVKKNEMYLRDVTRYWKSCESSPWECQVDRLCR